MVATGMKTLRQDLGDFSSIVCFKAVINGLEEALGEKTAAISLLAAGRKRGKDIAESIGVTGASDSISIDEIIQRVNQAIGKEGTRLCIVDKIDVETDLYKVYTRETLCSAGEPQGSNRNCTFTLGAIQGFMETFLGKRLRGKQIGSVLRGDSHDILEFAILA